MRRKALILTTSPRTDELEELLVALGADVGATVLQKRSSPDPVTFLGAGKLEEARDTQRAVGAEIIVVNGVLKAGQIFAIQRFFGQLAEGENARRDAQPVEVYDRTRLILEIFRERAQSPEARLQVELAQLTYDMPLVKEAIHLEKRGERQAAMFGGGEYGVNEYHDMMKRRMARLRRDLENVRRERGVRRKHRRRGGFVLVSLAGYTNAGKSSLLQALSQRETLVEDRYFSTLSTKTARAQSDRREILVTDTVGFIEDLPPWMVEAFHSTLEEIALADVILLVLDASDPVDEMSRRLRSSLRILHEFDASMPIVTRGSRGQRSFTGLGSRDSESAAIAPRAPILVALNKVDRVTSEELDAKQLVLESEGLISPESTVRVSAHTREGIEDVYARLYTLIPDHDEYEVALPSSPESEALVAWIHDHTDVLDMSRGNEVHLHFEAKRSVRTALLARLQAVGATALREVLRGRDGSRSEEKDVHAEEAASATAEDAAMGPAGSGSTPEATPDAIPSKKSEE